MKILGRSQNRGVALTIAIFILVMLVAVGGYMMSMGYNQKRMVDVSSGVKIRLYYNAQAGIVDANWRIRSNVGANFSGDPNATLNYTLNDGTIRADVSISRVGATRPGLRDISSIGKDQ